MVPSELVALLHKGQHGLPTNDDVTRLNKLTSTLTYELSLIEQEIARVDHEKADNAGLENMATGIGTYFASMMELLNEPTT